VSLTPLNSGCAFDYESQRLLFGRGVHHAPQFNDSIGNRYIGEAWPKVDDHSYTGGHVAFQSDANNPRGRDGSQGSEWCPGARDPCP